MTAAPTIKQVARHAGVSTATVSRVLSGMDSVSEQLRARVWDAVHTLDYHPNRVARSLRVRTTRSVGLLISDIQNPFFTSVARGIEDTLLAQQYTLLLGNSDEKPEREQLYLATLRAEGVAGLIFTPSNADARIYQSLTKAHIPLVAIDRTPTGLACDTVTVANVAGAHNAVAHLLQVGHRRIGMVAGPTHIMTADERQQGYEQALHEAGIAVDPQLVVQTEFRQQGGYAAMQALLDLAQPPSAVFVANNMMTLGALQALHERGCRIPGDMAVIGFDDMAWAASLQPPLTAIVQPTYEMGVHAAQLLLARLADPQRPYQHIVLPTRLVVRASCGVAHT